MTGLRVLAFAAVASGALPLLAAGCASGTTPTCGDAACGAPAVEEGGAPDAEMDTGAADSGAADAARDSGGDTGSAADAHGGG